MGKESYPNVTRLLLAAEGGGCNGSRVMLWKKMYCGVLLMRQAWKYLSVIFRQERASGIKLSTGFFIH